MSNTLYWECYSGISGDMAVASLLDLGADEKVLCEALQSLPVSGFQIKISRVKKNGLDACDFDVIVDKKHENHDHDMEYLHGKHGDIHGHEEQKHGNHDHEEHMHEEHTHEEHSHEQRGMIEIMDIIRVAEITEGARKIAGRIFEILAAAEAKAHQVPVEKVHFHEVGAVDSIVDIVAVAVCLDNLGIDEVVVPVLYEGKGFVRCQHGLLPVPVPAVANITADHHLKVHTTDVEGELVTPTGAAIVAAVRTSSQLPKQYTIRKIGLGAGKRQYECPGIVRAMLIEEEAPEKEKTEKKTGYARKILEKAGVNSSITEQIIHRFVGDENPNDGRYRSKVGNLASIVGIICNVLLFVGKFVVGMVFGSMAIAADAFNNLSDAGSSVISLFGFWLGSKKADAEHPYGHARYEYLSALAVCVIILAIGLNLAVEGIGKIIHPTGIRFSWLTIMVLMASILVKLWLSHFNGQLAEMIDSDTLRATSADARNDCLSTAAVLIAILLVSATQVERIDGVMTVAVAAFIMYSGYGMLRDAIAPLLGERPDPELVKKIEKRVMSYPQVLGMHDLMVHDYGPGNQFASLHIELAAEMDNMKAHDLIDNIEWEFQKKEQLPVIIHYDPIVTKNRETVQLREYLADMVKVYDDRLAVHDLRIVPGDSHTNVLFDLVLPAGYDGDQEKVLDYVKKIVHEKNEKYICVIKVEQSYV